MKQQATTQTPKQTMPPPTRGLLPHAAVRATSDHDLFANSPAESGFDHDFSQVAVRHSAPIVSRNYLNASSPPWIQAKLKIGQPGDKYELEADRVAEQVMRMPDPGLSSLVGDSLLANGGSS
ncbi:MAG: hypothetical protein L3J62_11755 [Gammaproteobacteria bacterium]|nr:hypothetical protein [Gammaproteobacteria bacterium]MCF6231433.1 hypothetical protein [Gammaproteobacteria bacterium]